MIKSFPDFSALTIRHRPEIEAITADFEPFSDFNFTSLFSWNVDGSTEISNLNGNLIVKLGDYLTGRQIYSLLGKNNVDEALKGVLKVAPRLEMVPQPVIKKLDKKDYRIQEDRNNFDYIYKISELADMPGGKYKKTRNKISRIIRALDGSLSVNNTKLGDAYTKRIEGLIGVLNEWSNTSGRTSEDLEFENSAMRRLLKQARQFDLLLTEVIIGNQVKAFSINEIVNSRYAICHFEKASLDFKDTYPYLINEVANNLRHHNCAYVNWEQDLGLPGLRRSKLDYHPVKFLKKFSIASV